MISFQNITPLVLKSIVYGKSYKIQIRCINVNISLFKHLKVMLSNMKICLDKTLRSLINIHNYHYENISRLY